MLSLEIICKIVIYLDPNDFKNYKIIFPEKYLNQIILKILILNFIKI